MTLYPILLSFLASYFIVIGKTVDFKAQYELIERFLTTRNLDTAVFYTCWSHTDRIKSMKTLNEKKIAITYRNKGDFKENFNLDVAFTISVYSPLLGIIVDWSCNEDISFKVTFNKFSEYWMWNASYHWLMIMETNFNKSIQSFLTSKNINLTVSSEVLLAHSDDFVTNWHISDVYRTAFEPRGQLMIDVVNETFGKWGNRLWKYDKRSNLENLTLNAITVDNAAEHTRNQTKLSTEEVTKFLKTFSLDRSNSIQKYCYAVMYQLTRHLLNITMNIKTTNSWGFKINNTWDGIVKFLISGEADFSLSVNSIRIERLEVLGYSAVSTYKHEPCFIFRHPRSSSSIKNMFLRPFKNTVWFSLFGIFMLSTFVYYTVVHFELNQMFSLRSLSDVILLKIGTLCQQGTTMEPMKLSNRLIVFVMFTFSLIVYQFYSSSIVSGLLRPTVINIDSIRKLEESGLDVGVEDFSALIRMIEGATDPYLRKIIDKKIIPKSEYLLAKEGVKKIKNGFYAFFTVPATSYWLINEIFTEREKCDLSELAINRGELTAFPLRKNSPYKKLIDHAMNKLLETGIMHREHRIWFAKKPQCIGGKRITDESLVSVEFKDVSSLLTFLFIGFIVSLTILILEIIVYHYNKKK